MDHINVFDCSKVSDGAAAILCVSEEGLHKLGIGKDQAVRVAGFGQVESDLTTPPEDLTRLDTTSQAASRALEMSGLSCQDIATLELHDCFTISAILALESAGFVEYGKAPQYILDGHTGRDGKFPVNTTAA